MDDYCDGWPACSCAREWQRWVDLGEEDEWMPDEFVIMCSELQIAALLYCVSTKCPDPAFRRHATQQLKHPRFSMAGHVDA
jgi:hypothetical protein